MEAAPFDVLLSEGPEAARSLWIEAADGVRLRITFWPVEGASGTILIFPGRTEYCEKYGRVAREFAAAGFAVAVIDWRGQGYSARLTDDERLGHVLHFRDYQKDVAAFQKAVDEAGLPGPLFLVAHSMGGCIGLRALIDGLAVERAVFSAPMWGIHVPPRMKPVAATLPVLAKYLGQSLRVVPGTLPTNYISDTVFAENMLTTDPDHYAFMSRQALAHPAFALGGPTLHWLAEARREMRAVARAPRPAVPARTYLGSLELVVDPVAIRRMHANWPSGELAEIDGAKHELLMEVATVRDRILDETIGFFRDSLA